MKNKKELVLSLIQLITAIIGAAFALGMDFPQGIILLMPLGAAPLIQILKLKKKQAK